MMAPTKIDTSLLLNKKKKKGQFLNVNYVWLLEEPVKILKLKLES